VAASPEKTRPPNRISQWPLTRRAENEAGEPENAKKGSMKIERVARVWHAADRNP
jgi:hypothetical protein